ncbi:MAG: type II toxin-antitoxin system RatA family toxin [Alphaproteobacteria bacterium]|jgi:coenzyme Q-binding protein COQ10|nr:type II toxin-antitoxin system RatA family toxin [Alphaproteobacteria bacterium]
MPTHAEQRTLPYRPEQLFDLVADIERYPEFLPWCIACRVSRRQGNVIWGDLMVGFKVFREKFTSKVTLSAPDRIDVEYIDGPFRYLNNHWRFIPEDGGRATTIDFYVDFEFHSRALQAVARAAFNEAVKRMVQAFEKRAREVHGDAPAVRRQPAHGGVAD